MSGSAIRFHRRMLNFDSVASTCCSRKLHRMSLQYAVYILSENTLIVRLKKVPPLGSHVRAGAIPTSGLYSSNSAAYPLLQIVDRSGSDIVLKTCIRVLVPLNVSPVLHSRDCCKILGRAQFVRVNFKAFA